MSLLQTYSDSNKNTDTLLSIRYSIEYADGLYRTTRKASKSYSFIGMDRETAESCRDAKIAQYTRTYINLDSANPRTEVIGSESYELPGINAYTACGAECVSRHDHDGSWRVDIVVDETDVIMTVQPATDPASLFEQWTMLRTYDETYKDSILNCWAAYCSTAQQKTSLHISWLPEFFDDAQSLHDFTDLHVYYKATASQVNWTEASYTIWDSTILDVAIYTAGYFWKVKSGDYSSPVIVSTEV